MSSRRLVQLVVCTIALALVLPAVSRAHHIRTIATVSAQLKERKSANTWIVEIMWTASCQGASNPTYNGNLFLVDTETGARTHVGGVVDSSGRQAVSGQLETYVSAIERAQYLKPEIKINCNDSFPLDGAPEITVTGNVVIIPPLFGSGGGGGGGAGGAGDDYGSGDPTAPLGAGGCGPVIVGTNGPDTLTGDDAGEVVFAFDGNDTVKGRRGHDCLIGQKDNDRLEGGPDSDRLTGGRGSDILIGGPGLNAYDAGPGNDYVSARNGKRELVRCGPGHDRVRADRRDRLRNCERVSRPRR